MQITTIGLDIAKNVFQVHGIDAAEKVVVCLIGMEACATAHCMAAPERFAEKSDSSCNAGAVHTWPEAPVCGDAAI
jgi:hypothetical protein